jgi:hypothetical protein
MTSFSVRHRQVDVIDSSAATRRVSGVVSIAQNLSHDVLYYIFAMTRHDANATSQEQIQTSTALSQVCHSWRYTALTSPSLWTNIRMKCYRRRPHHNWVRRLFQRARNLPIDFAVDLLRPFEEHELSTIILPNFPRIRQFTLTASSDLLMPLLFKELTEGLPLLEEFVFQVKAMHHGARFSVSREPQPLGQPFRVPPVTRRHQISWSDWAITNLKSLSVDYIPRDMRPTYKDLLEICSLNCSSLESMSFRGFGPELPSWLPQPTVRLPALTALSIGYMCPVHYVPVFTSLCVPNLASLALRDISRCPEKDTPGDTLAEFEQSEENHLRDASDLLTVIATMVPHTIKTLSLIGVEADEPSSVQLVQTLTDLQSLTLYKTTSALFQAICTSVPETTLQPSESDVYPGMSLSNLLVTDIPPATIMNYLDFRAAANLPRLKRLTVDRDCVASGNWQLALRSAVLTILALGADVTTVLVNPVGSDSCVPLKEHTLLDHGALNTKTWEWLGNTALVIQ